MNKLSDRIKAVRFAVRLARLLVRYKDLVAPHGVPYFSKRKRDVGGSIEICDKHVIKQYQSKQVCDSVKTVLEAVRKAGISNTIYLSEQNGAKNKKALLLEPVGVQRSPQDYNEMVKTVVVVLMTVIRLHRIDYCHCDLRWPNIIFDSHNNPILIDFEYARHIGSPTPVGLKHRYVDKKCIGSNWDIEADAFQVGKLIIENEHSTQDKKNLVHDLHITNRSTPAKLLGRLKHLGGLWQSYIDQLSKTLLD